MNNDPEIIKEMFQNYTAGTATADEVRQLFALITSNQHDSDLRQLLLNELDDTDEDPSYDKTRWNRVLQKIKKAARRLDKKQRPVINYIGIAALLLAALATALYFYPSIVHRTSEFANDIDPGYNRATLTLADGTKVNLDSAKTGIQINDEHIVYNDKTPLNVILSGEGRNAREGAEGSLPTSLTLTTPKGGQYQIILSDGTKVWLNAASTLKYPGKFTGDTREVFLEGEAFFEVNNNRSIGAMQANRKSYLVNRKSNTPFIVKSQNQEITVLGTSFNVTAFADEKETKTTLVEGKVQVRSENVKRKTYNLQLLSPQQQAVVKGESLTVSKADVEAATAWRNGYFSFEGETIQSIMNKIARWYNVEVAYEGPIPTDIFGGSASRFDKVSKVLHVLQLTGKVNFKIENRKIIVSP